MDDDGDTQNARSKNCRHTPEPSLRDDDIGLDAEKRNQGRKRAEESRNEAGYVQDG